MGIPSKLVVASRNPGKVLEIRQALAGLGVTVVSLDEAGVRVALEEPHDTFEANAREKARAVARAAGEWALADDSGLEVDALGGRPGVLSSRFAGPDASDEERNAQLLSLMRDVPPPGRSARFVCVLAVAAPSGETQVWRGTCEGHITREPRGTSGFGFDPVFELPDLGRTMAELSVEEKNLRSHRGAALRAMREAFAEDAGCGAS